jgi:hypothetical protein
MFMPSMREFLQSGRLGEVQLGLRRDRVMDILGAPEDQTARRRPLQLLRYGAVEFGFIPVPETTDSRLVSTALYFHDPDRLIPPPLRPTDWLPTHATSAQQFRQFLNEAGIEANCSIQGQEAYLILSSGASVVFAEGKLHSIHFKRKDKKPQRKQMTVSLPEEAGERLQHRAHEEGISVQAIIERMIEAGT